MIKVPEYILLEAVKNALKYIRVNYANQEDKDTSYLRRLLRGTVVERYDYITQAETVFLADQAETRYLDVDLMFNNARDGAPSIHITLPSENTQNEGNGMGNDLGYQTEMISEDLEADVFTRRYQATYNIVITSDNSDEVVLIYHTLRALLISFTAPLHLAGLENVNFGGQDITLEQNALFFRAITVSLQYETSAPNPWADQLFHSITATGKPIAA